MRYGPMAGLLGTMSQASAAVSGAPDPLEEENEIVVDGNTIDLYALENPQSIQQRDMARDTAEQTAQHKGMFGTKGTLRDILGLVGDAFLIQSGNNPIYAPKRRQERMSDAMAGFTDKPLEAIERVAGINPEAAQKMMEQYQANQYRTGQLGAENMRAQTSAANVDRQTLEQARSEASQAIAGALAVGTPQALAYAQRLAMQAAEAYNLTPEQLGLPQEALTPEMAQVLAGRGATVNQTLNRPIAQQRADTGSGQLSERRRSNRQRERQNATNEAGRNRRAAEAEEGRETRSQRSSDNRSSGGRRQLRGDDQNPTSSKRFY